MASNRKYKKILWIFISIIGIAFLYFLYLTFTGKLVVSPTLVNLGPFQIRYYGILIVLSVFMGYYFIKRDFEKLQFDFSFEEVEKTLLYSILVGFFGARLYQVAFNWDFYGRYPGEILAVWHGGLAIYGGILFGFGFAFIYMTIKKLPALRLMDIASPYMLLAQAICRWGNFFNHEAYGGPTNLLWKLYIPPEARIQGYTSFGYFHPTFLYESILDLIGFVILKRFIKRKRRGNVFFAYIGIYSINRFIVEFFRIDTNKLYCGFKLAHIFAIGGMTVALLWFIFNLKSSEASEL
jgi:phosphatidylglycerol:prolipoprotein diacylglycerol transferase